MDLLTFRTKCMGRKYFVARAAIICYNSQFSRLKTKKNNTQTKGWREQKSS